MTISEPFLISPEAFAVAMSARWMTLDDFSFSRLTQPWFKQWDDICRKRAVPRGERG